MSNLRVSSQTLSLTRPLWAKHCSQINANRAWSSSPRTASASLSYHCFREGPDGGWGGERGTKEFFRNTRIAEKGETYRQLGFGMYSKRPSQYHRCWVAWACRVSLGAGQQSFGGEEMMRASFHRSVAAVLAWNSNWSSS